jgi:oxygen-independent coproporphyrinogen-3 oxidase
MLSQMDPRYITYAERQAPRYTSYPSAPHFTNAVDDMLYGDWIAALPENAALSLYIHVPYCREICWYCGCNTFAARRDEPVSNYVETLLREIELVGDKISARRTGELHWGGGTPNILSPAEFSRIYRQLGFWFDIDESSLHSIEIDPRHLTADHARAYVEARVTRASIGAQDFNPHVQKGIGRIQPAALVRRAVDTLRGAGVHEINMDLMYGLPGQAKDDLLHSLRIAAEMAPQRIALFGYAHVPWFKKRQRLIDETQLPSAPQRFDCAEAARSELAKLGYVAIGLDHFALPDDDLAKAACRGELQRSFQGYTAGAPLPIVGLGPSAISTLPQGYAQNLAEVGAWSKAVNEPSLPIARGHELSHDDRLRGDLIMEIMCSFSADLAPLGGAEQCAHEIAALAPLMKDGLISLSGDKLSIAESGRPFCRLVAQAFDAYASANARHSAAV